MFKLLRANLFRLKKDKVFWIALLVMLAEVFAILHNCRRAVGMMKEGYQGYEFLDKIYFNPAPLIAFFFAIIISLYLGREYGDGTLRNKIIAGHTRAAVYLANLFTSFLISASFLAVWLVGGLAGLYYLKAWRLSVSWTVLYILIILLLNFALASIFTLIGMLVTNKAATAVVTILTFLALLVSSTVIYNKLSQPEMVSGVEMTVEGMKMHDPEPNPFYIGGTKRKVYEKVLRILPTGQAVLVSNEEITEAVLPIAASVVLILLVSGSGIALFQRKDLK